MIDFAVIDDPLERTQRLPLLTTEVQLEEALARERAARTEASELFRQNAELVKELARLRYAAVSPRPSSAASRAPALRRQDDTEEMLFEVCATLKLTLSRVLAESQMRSHLLNCGDAARRTLHDCGDKLESILSDPATWPSALSAGAVAPAPRGVPREASPAYSAVD